MNTIICTKKDPFSSLKTTNPELYRIAKYLSAYMERDRRITCFYSRLLAEQIIKKIFYLQKERLYTDSLMEMLKTSAVRQAVTTDIILKIEHIARIGNKAAHQLPKPNAQSTLNCLRDLLDVVRWFTSKFYNIKVNLTLSSQVFKFDTKENQKDTNMELSKIGEIIDEFIEIKTKKNSRNIYRKALNDFCKLVYPKMPTEAAIKSLLESDESEAMKVCYDHRQILLESTLLANSSICQKISVINSFIYYAFSNGYCEYNISTPLVPRYNSKPVPIDSQSWMGLLSNIDKTTPKGIRDYTILQLLIDEKLARQDISRIELENIDGLQLSIPIEGSTRYKVISLSPTTKSSIESWLKLRPQVNNKYLFTRLSKNLKDVDSPLSERGIYQIIRSIGEAANLDYSLNARNISNSLK